MVQWRGRQESENVEDERGQGIGRGMVVGGGGLGTLVIILVVSWLTHRNPLELLSEVQQQQPSATSAQQGQPGPPPADDEQAKFVSVILKDTEDTWHQVLPPLGVQYTEPHLVLFSDAVQSACGMASAAVGPFYCSQDSKVYLDMSFFRELDQRFGAPGDFARAYVVAHEVGHHVQNLLGISAKVQEHEEAARTKAEANAYSVRLELQADCFAGVWAHHAQQDRNLLDPGDIDEGLRAAAAIGDDRLQKEAQGYVVPESFTHGTSEQRVHWFRAGFDGGNPNACDTFGARNL
jgi:predicted metalloprotease